LSQSNHVLLVDDVIVSWETRVRLKLNELKHQCLPLNLWCLRQAVFLNVLWGMTSEYFLYDLRWLSCASVITGITFSVTVQRIVYFSISVFFSVCLKYVFIWR